MPGEAEIVRPACRDDVPALGDLFEEVFGARRDPAIWIWKYFDNPRGCMSFVCEAAGRLVAHCAGTPVVFRDRGRDTLALQVSDIMSSPRHTGGAGRGGVFYRTMKGFFDAYCGPNAIPVVYGFPGERHRLVGERLLGYSAVEPVCEFHLDAGTASRRPEPLALRDLDFFGRLPLRTGAVRDLTYLRWRYADHPVARYGKVAVRRRLLPGTQIAALVREDDRMLQVMEVAGRFSRTAVEDLAAALAAAGKEVLLWGSPEHPVGRALAEGGFSVRERDHWLEVRRFDGGPAPAAGELYYSLGDYDVY